MKKFTLLAFICWSALGSAQVSYRNLSVDDAIEIAWANNPSIKAKRALTDVSIAQMQQLTAVQTPWFSFGTLFPVHSPGAQTAFDIKVSQNIDGFFSLSKRIDAASLLKESERWANNAEISRLVADVKIAFYRYQASLEMKTYWQDNLEAARAIADLARAQKKAGNINALDEAQREAFEKMAKLEFARMENQALQLRIALMKTLGMQATDSTWSVDASLPQMPEALPDTEILKQKAFSTQPQLRSYRNRVEGARLQLQASRIQFFPQINLGVSAAFDAEGNRGVGPFIEFGLPYFGRPQADARRAEADLRVNSLSLAAAQNNLTYEIDELIERMRLAHKTALLYRTDIFPVQERILKESLKHYNFMLLGTYQLLNAKQNQIKARQDELQARLDYWLASVELDTLTGSMLDSRTEVLK